MDAPASRATDPALPGDGSEVPAAERVDPVVPDGNTMMPSDGTELPVAELSEPAVTSPSDTAAACALPVVNVQKELG